MTATDHRPRPTRRRPTPSVHASTADPPSRRCCCRDFYVLRKNLKEFIPRTILQPLLLVFVFTYVFPKIGQGIGGSAGRRAVLDHARRRGARPR